MIAIPDMIKNIEDEKQPSPFRPMEDKDSLSLTPNEIRILKDFAAAINALIKVRQ